MSDPVPAVAEDRRAVILAAGINALWELEGDDAVDAQDAADFINLLDRLDERDGVVRVNLLKQRAIEAQLGRCRAALHAAVTAFENGVTPPPSMLDGWRNAEAGR